MKRAIAKSVQDMIGWREWVGLPDLGIDEMRAKIDTGARTSALHAVDHEYFKLDGVRWVRFSVPASAGGRLRRIEAPIADERDIRNTSGVAERRIIIETTVLLGRHHWHIEASLANREKMEFDLILGRTALRKRRVLVDPGKSFIAGKPLTEHWNARHPVPRKAAGHARQGEIS
jgi:hypothetical protein